MHPKFTDLNVVFQQFSGAKPPYTSIMGRRPSKPSLYIHYKTPGVSTGSISDVIDIRKVVYAANASFCL